MENKNKEDHIFSLSVFHFKRKGVLGLVWTQQHTQKQPICLSQEV